MSDEDFDDYFDGDGYGDGYGDGAEGERFQNQPEEQKFVSGFQEMDQRSGWIGAC